MLAMSEHPSVQAEPAVVELLIDDRPAGRSREDDLDNADWTVGRLLRVLDRRGSVRVLQEVRGAVSFDAAAQSGMKQLAARHGQRIGRLALVGEPAALRRRASILEPLIGGEVRCFSPTDRLAAQRWLTAA